MKVTGLAISPPRQARDCPKVTPELLASSLARYSRSNKGIEAILAKIDWEDPDKSVDAIFRFVDYGHASIGGLTGGIAIAVDGCSLLLGLKLFEIAQLADGQESSTRYIQVETSGLADPAELGIPPSLASEWHAVMAQALEIYGDVHRVLESKAAAEPTLVRAPKDTSEKVMARMRKNYALDRARYFIPVAARTNVALIMSARVWGQTIRQLDASPLPEAQLCALHLRGELEKFAPRLTRHSFKDDASITQAFQEVEFSREAIARHGVGIENIPDEVFVSVDRGYPAFLPDIQSISDSAKGKINRYSTYGEALRRIFVRFAWNNVSLAELRDLNRHRTGYRFTPLLPVGFYLPPEVHHREQAELLHRHKLLIEKLATQRAGNGCHFYGYLLGEQTAFEHSTHADKFIYEVELRTGLGAHFRYAQHLMAAAAEFTKLVPEAKPLMQIGTAEPE